MAARIIPNGMQVDIISPEGIHHRGWGSIIKFDGRYHVALYNGTDTGVFDRDELKVTKHARLRFKQQASVSRTA